jgi:hypothetical protein
MTCPCESGRRPRACCRCSNGSWYKAPERFEPPPPATGFSHPDCFLNVTQDCNRTITGEHYVSDVALSTIHPVLRVSGVSWLQAPKDLPVGAFTSNILCERHNSAFGSIDHQGGRFFRWLRDFSSSSAQLRRTRVLFSGHDIERWCLKTFLGLLASHNLQSSPGQVVRYVHGIPEAVELLFGRVPDTRGRGLWVRGDARHIVNADPRLVVSPVTKEGTDELRGLTLNIHGFDFVYSTAPIDVRASVFRPSYLKFHRPDCVAIIELSWAPGVPHSDTAEWHWERKRAEPTPVS